MDIREGHRVTVDKVLNYWQKSYECVDNHACMQVQMDIREGHAVTVDKVLNWLAEEGGVKGVSVCDAGCGTGSLSIPLALQGAKVYGSDISEAMVRLPLAWETPCPL